MCECACSVGLAVWLLVVVVLLNVLGCRLTYKGQAETNAEAWFNVALCPMGDVSTTTRDEALVPQYRMCQN